MGRGALPGPPQGIGRAEAVQDPRDEAVDELLDGGRAVVEAGGGGHDRGSCLGEGREVPHVYEREGRLAGREDEGPALLEGDRPGAVDEVPDGSRGEGAGRAHVAGDYGGPV